MKYYKHLLILVAVFYLTACQPMSMRSPTACMGKVKAERNLSVELRGTQAERWYRKPQERQLDGWENNRHSLEKKSNNGCTFTPSPPSSPKKEPPPNTQPKIKVPDAPTE